MATKRSKWKTVYEPEKRKLQNKQLPPGEYEKEIKRITKRKRI